jgi:hypothetical protein
MKNMIPAAIICLWTTWAGAWGDEGHQTIAQVAFERLTPAVRGKVGAILDGATVEDTAVWPDKIRGGNHPGPLAGTPEGKAFNKKFTRNSLWHFVDLPLDTQAYGKNPEFTSTNDVVHALALCIDVLEAKSSAMSQLEALRWTIHLAGDIHQPLHVACGYFEFDDQADPHLHTSPAFILSHGLTSGDDKGGNKLHYTETEKLHHYWDTVLVNNAAVHGQQLKDVLTAHIAQAHYKNTGAYRSWPTKWATASVAVARAAYEDLDINERDSDRDGWFIHVKLPQDRSKMVAAAKDQMALAAFNLSALLNKIKWQ